MVPLEKSHLAIAPKNEIKYGQRSSLIKDYQLQNNLTQSGIFDNEMLAFVQEQQELLGFNVTKTLDYNTWFATYPQPVKWQEDIINESLIQWQNILNKQTLKNTSRFIVVNIPTMTLNAYDWNGTDATEILSSKVVVGKVNSKTPPDDFSIWGLKYNPTWTPTPNMLKRNVFTANGINTQWLSSHRVKALNSQGQEIPYSAITKSDNIRFVQPAGNNNALGILKFETNSKENIYLHDTNEKSLFSHNTRAYSAGCIRVESFENLAQWVAQIDEDTLSSKLKNKNTRIEKITNEIPVYFTYSQVYFIQGEPVFAPDIYKQKNNIIYK